MEVKPFHHFLATVKKEKIPFSVVFEITGRCNLRCRHCYQKEGPDHLGTEEIKGILDDLKEAGCLKLTLTGGEPTIREDFAPILSHALREGFAVTLFTNATFLTPEVKGLLQDGPLYGVESSLYGATADTHDAVTGVEGSFEKTLANLRWMAGEGLRVTVKSVTMSVNLHELDALSQLTGGLGFRFQPSYRLFPSADPHRAPEDLRVPTEYIRDLKERPGQTFEREQEPSESIPADFICNAGREACCISAEGKVYPCTAMRWECGDLKKEPFSRVWRESPVLKKIRSYTEDDFEECRDCPWKAECSFCPGMGWTEHGNMHVPSREICRLTRAGSPQPGDRR